MRSVFLVSGWGERFPIRFECEQEFGLDGYSGILTEELVALHEMIDQQGIGKAGEKYVRSVLSPPTVKRIDDRPAKGSPPLTLPQWNLRYAAKTDKIYEHSSILGRLANRWKRAVWPRIWRMVYKQAWALELLLGRFGLGREISRPVRVKWLVGMCLRQLISGRSRKELPVLRAEVSDSPGLAEILRSTKQLVCASRLFWINNRRLVKKSLPWRSCQFLSVDEKTTIDMGDVVRIPLRRYEAGSFEAWALYHAIECPSETLLVINGNDLDKTMGLLREKLLPQHQIILVSQNLPDGATRFWKRWTSVSEGLWLLQSPLPPLLRTLAAEEPINGWPKISVVTVSFNQALYIGSCLDSVLDQGYPNLEYIVVDGGSTDGTRQILERYRDRLSLLIIEPDKGQSDALNKGFRAATGDVMNWVCSDDLLEPEALFNIGRAFTRSEVDLVAGGCRVVNAQGKTLYSHHNGLPFDRIVDLSFGDLLSFLAVWQRGMFFFQPEVFFSRRIWETSGGYIKEHLYFGMDYELYLRMAMAGARILHIPHYIAASRRHDNQKTRHEDKLYLPTFRTILEEYRRLIQRTGEVTRREPVSQLSNFVSCQET